jgi:hypothetical protein
MERIAFSVLLDPASVKAWNIRRNAETQLISVRRKAGAGAEGQAKEASGPQPPIRKEVNISLPEEFLNKLRNPSLLPKGPSTSSSSSPTEAESSPSSSSSPPTGKAVPSSTIDAKLTRLHGPHPRQIRNLIETFDGKLFHVRETFVLDSSWNWGTKIHPQEVQGFITECEKTPKGKVRFIFDGVYADESGKDVAIKFQAQVDEEIARRWEIGPKKAVILEPYEPLSKAEESPGTVPPEGRASEENETRSLPPLPPQEEISSSSQEPERAWLNAAGQYCGPEEIEGSSSVPPSPADSAISQPGKKITFSPGGSEVDPSGVTMMAGSEPSSRLPKTPAAREFSHPVITAVRQVNPTLIDEMLRNIVTGAGKYRYVRIDLTPLEGSLACSPRYYEAMPPSCQDNQITLRINNTDPNRPSASLVDHRISSLPPEIQKYVRAASVFAEEVSTVHYPEGRVPKEVVEEVDNDMLLEVTEDGVECLPDASPAKDPLEATTHYVPEFEIWWQSQVQEVMSEYFRAAKKGSLKTGGRLRILLNKDLRGNTVQPLWYGFEQFPEKGPLPPLQKHQEPLLLIKIKGDLIRDPKAYQIVSVAKDLPESLKQRWETMMRRVVKNFR